jgi:hypothetical protein
MPPGNRRWAQKLPAAISHVKYYFGYLVGIPSKTIFSERLFPLGVHERLEARRYRLVPLENLE